MAFVVPLGRSKPDNGKRTKAMDPILPLLLCLASEVRMTTLRQLGRIALAMLAMTGRVTMLGLARWTGTGGSYRTIQRFFHTTLPWAAILWIFLRTQVLTPGDDMLLVGDECVVTKAGKETYGVDRFFPASLASRCRGSRSSRWPWSVGANGRRSRCRWRRCSVNQPARRPRPCPWQSGNRDARKAAAPKPRPMRR